LHGFLDRLQSRACPHLPTPFLAKDGNRPFLMRRAFAEHAELEMVVKTDAISFPSSARGMNAIEEILVRRFGVDYEKRKDLPRSQSI
jgi:hypothetical protein